MMWFYFFYVKTQQVSPKINHSLWAVSSERCKETITCLLRKTALRSKTVWHWVYHLLISLKKKNSLAKAWHKLKNQQRVAVIQKALFLAKYLEGHFKEKSCQLSESIWVNGFLLECGIYKLHNPAINAWWWGGKTNLPLPIPSGQKHTECFGDPSFTCFCACLMNLSSTLYCISSALHVSDVQETENKADRVLKQLLYVTHVPIKHRDN